MGGRAANLIGTLRFEYGRFRFRYWPAFRPWWEVIAIPVHLLFDLLFPRHWQQLVHFWQYSPRSLRKEHFPAIRGDSKLTIGIVTPSYNQGGFVERTIRSVLDQEYRNLQYAVVDGGSEDGTLEILRRYEADFAYFKSGPDGGQSEALVDGFSHIEGDVMAYLNSDDILMPGSLEFVGNFFRRYPEVDVIYGHRVMIDEFDREVGRWILPRHNEHVLRRWDFIPQETMFWRRSLYERVGGINTSFHYAMDWDLILRFMDAGASFRRVPYFLACFRMHAAQKTQSLGSSIGEAEVAELRGRQGIRQSEIPPAVFGYRRSAAVCSLAHALGVRL